MQKFTKYTVKLKRGIDDLKFEYAFKGNSQGDESVSNLISDYIASKGWMSYMFNCPLAQYEINEEVERRKKWNIDYIVSLYKEGRYGEEYEVTLELIPNPLYDTPQVFTDFPLQSCKMVFLDFTKPEEK